LRQIGAGYRMTLVGTAALSGPTLVMAALLQPASGPLRLPFSLKGPLSAPAFELQTDALLRPAGAAEGETLPLR
jgi:AsmA protein